MQYLLSSETQAVDRKAENKIENEHEPTKIDI